MATSGEMKMGVQIADPSEAPRMWASEDNFGDLGFRIDHMQEARA
jgi:hypothetical protein